MIVSTGMPTLKSFAGKHLRIFKHSSSVRKRTMVVHLRTCCITN